MASNWPTNGNPFAGYPYSGAPYTDDPWIDGEEEEKVEWRPAETRGGLPIPGGIAGSIVALIWFAGWLSYQMLRLLLQVLRFLSRWVRGSH